MRWLRLTLCGQLDEKQASLEQTASLVETMFAEFSALQGVAGSPAARLKCMSCPSCRPLMPPCAVEFLALKAKTSVVPGDAHDVAALHAALDSKDK